MRDYKYKAFISYSWSDKVWGQWILRALEQYRTPKTLIGRQTPIGPVPPRLHPLFKDREEEAASAGIGNVVEQALDNSEFLIVVCSPHSVKSDWVNREIAYFKANRNPKKILTLVVEGTPGASRGAGDPDLECFPPAILNRIDESGTITTEPVGLPLAADARPEGDGKRNAKLKLAAAMLGVGLDELIRREDKRRSNQRLVLTAFTTIIALVTSGLAVTAALARDEAVAAKATADQRRVEAEGLVEFMITDMRDQLRAVNRLDVLDMTAQRTLQYYAKQDPGSLDPDALGRRARAMLLFGEVHNSKGNLDDALAAYRQAADTTAEQIRRDPNNPQRIFDHSQSVFWVGYIAWQRGDAVTAKNYWIQYHKYAEQLVLLEPGNEDWIAELLYAHSNLGTLAFDQGDADQAEHHFDEALTLSIAAFGNQPDTVQGAIDLGQSYSWLAEALYLQVRISDAQAARIAELAVYDAIKDQASTHATLRSQEATARYSLAQFLLASGDIEQSVKQAEHATAMSEELFGNEPTNLEEADRASLANTILGEAYLHAGKMSNARVAFTRAISIGEQLTSTEGTVLRWKGKVSTLPILMLARADELDGRSTQAQSSYARLTENLGPMLRQDASEPAIAQIYCAARAGQARLSSEPSQYHAEVISILTSDTRTKGAGTQVVLAESLLQTGQTEAANVIVEKLYRAGFRHPDFLTLLNTNPEILPQSLRAAERQSTPR